MQGKTGTGTGAGAGADVLKYISGGLGAISRDADGLAACGWGWGWGWGKLRHQNSDVEGQNSDSAQLRALPTAEEAAQQLLVPSPSPSPPPWPESPHVLKHQLHSKTWMQAEQRGDVPFGQLVTYNGLVPLAPLALRAFNIAQRSFNHAVGIPSCGLIASFRRRAVVSAIPLPPRALVIIGGTTSRSDFSSQECHLPVSPLSLVLFFSVHLLESVASSAQAVQVGVGTPAQQVALYPGGTFRSHLLTPRICSNVILSPDPCFASPTGLYAVESSSTAVQSAIHFPAAVDYSHGGLRVQGRQGIPALDRINIGTSGGLRKTTTVPNVTIVAYDDVAAIYPSGALKALQATNLTPSNSFGLHIGSVQSKIKGSLHFGGYEQTRICGNISTQRGPFAGIEPDDDGKKGLIDLLDIKINVVEGSSPFNASTINNLLASGNSSVGPALSVSLPPEAPYLDLPKSTCGAIAAWLPVTYNAGLGLYTWNINGPRFSQIVSSPSVLSFVFQKDQINTQNITINVPFMLLNLTLEAPLVTSAVPYFPCNAQSNGKYRGVTSR